jgi:hypothetical protein
MKARLFKKGRLEFKRLVTGLFHRKENIECITYESNPTFLIEPAVPTDENDDESNLEGDVGDIPIDLLYLGTSGFEANCDILQIAAKCGETTFATYVNPSRQVSATATAANGLMNCNGDLVHHGVKVQSVPMRLALVSFIEWLGLFKNFCIAVHNLRFDGPRLFRAIFKYFCR